VLMNRRPRPRPRGAAGFPIGYGRHYRGYGLYELDQLYELPYLARMAQTRGRKGVNHQSDQWVMRDARTGAFLAVVQPSDSVAMPPILDLSRWKGDKNALSTVFRVFNAAISKSREADTEVQFTVEVDPGGAMRIVEDTPVVSHEIEADTEADGIELEQALEAARARGRNRVAEILAQPEMLNAEAFAKHLNTTRATINTKRLARQVLGLQGATRGYRYPAWQIDEEGRPFAALPDIFELLGDSPWAVYRFLVQNHPELGGLSGREALRRGRAQDAIAAAESVARAFT
jgi:hypothetical protein